MSKFYIAATSLIFAGALLFNSAAKAQSIQVFENYGPPVVSVNNSGKAITPSNYYDYATNTFTPAEADITRLYNINNNGDVTGSIKMTENPSWTQPAYKLATDTEWQRIPWFPESNPANSFFDIGAISSNGKYIAGYMSVGSSNFGGFVYNTETKEFIKILDENNTTYKTIRPFGINNNGITVGYVSKNGTTRIPMYMDIHDMVIHEIHLNNAHGLADMANDINNNNVIAGRIDGDYGYTYDINTQQIKTFDFPFLEAYGLQSMITNLMHISDSGKVVGQGLVIISPAYYEALIYDPASDPDHLQFLFDYFAAKGLSYTTPDGTNLLGQAYVISDNGRYIGGFCNGGVPGWMADLGADSTLQIQNTAKTSVSVYPNPASDYFSIKDGKRVAKISVYSADGKLVKVFDSERKEYSVSGLKAGVYIVSIEEKDGTKTTTKLIKK